MVVIKSARAQQLIKASKHWLDDPMGGMVQYQGADFPLMVMVEKEGLIVKKLSFHGRAVDDWKKAILESWASIMIKRPVVDMDKITLRECEAYLRDRNSEAALENVPADFEEKFQRLLGWIKNTSFADEARAYQFPSEKGPFRNLKLADKVRELKGFLNSPEVIYLYKEHRRPTLLDVSELTIYIDVPYDSPREKALLDELHALGVETFQEEELNFIPDA